MLNETHIINKQVFEFACSRYEDAFQLQKQMESGLQYSIQSCIDNAFSEWNDLTETVRIDKLEIDIGEIPFESLAALLPGKIYTGLSCKLDATLIPCRSSPDTIQKNENIDKAALLEIFLLSGSLPWWAGAASDFSLTETIQQLIENDTDGIKTLLLKHIQNKKFTERLVYQTGTALFEKLIAMLPSVQQLYLLFEGIVNKAFEYDSNDKVLEVINNSGIVDTENQQSIHTGKNIPQLILKFISTRPLPCTVEEVKLLLKEKMDEVFGQEVTNDSFKELIDTPLAKKIYSLIKTLEKDIEQVVQQESFLFDENTLAASGEKIYIQNAGLVLIATFLPALFKELQWTEDGVFTNREMQLKALFLLHYIATGIDAAPEYTLQLNKILCGFKLDETIPFSVGLTAKEKQEADQLLQDVIGHWAALKSSSAEALRGSFLLRDALLSYNNGRWLLQVERKGYDVLLDHIPWSWATVKCSWMETYIETEW